MSFTDKVLMIRPASFGYNAETAVNNSFQTIGKKSDEEPIKEQAQVEFDRMVELMTEAGVDVHVWNDSADPKKPDAVFPNNWFSTTPGGAMITYPMFAKNRRIEREEAILDYVEQQFHVERRYEFQHYEEQDLFLEGTGSMLFDHDAKIIYACLSPRTSIELLDKMSVLAGYEIIAFTSVDRGGQPIYHTNVMMALGVKEVIICLDSIPDEAEKLKVQEAIARSNRSIIDISYDQVEAFAGNMIQLKNQLEEPVLVMSKQAYDSLTELQVKELESTSAIVAPDISTIEKYGGGSARCMIAEIFLREREAIV